MNVHGGDNRHQDELEKNFSLGSEVAPGSAQGRVGLCGVGLAESRSRSNLRSLSSPPSCF